MTEVVIKPDSGGPDSGGPKKSAVSPQAIVLLVVLSLFFLGVIGGVFVGVSYFLEKISEKQRAEDEERVERIKPTIEKVLERVKEMKEGGRRPPSE